MNEQTMVAKKYVSAKLNLTIRARLFVCRCVMYQAYVRVPTASASTLSVTVSAVRLATFSTQLYTAS